MAGHQATCQYCFRRIQKDSMHRHIMRAHRENVKQQQQQPYGLGASTVPMVQPESSESGGGNDGAFNDHDEPMGDTGFDYVSGFCDTFAMETDPAVELEDEAIVRQDVLNTWRREIHGSGGKPCVLDVSATGERRPETGTRHHSIYQIFDNHSQWLLAKRILFPEPLTNRQIKGFAVEPNCPWIKTGEGFKSLADFQRRQSELRSRDEWKESHIIAPVMGTVKFWERRDIMKVLTDLVGNSRLANHMRWAPEKLYCGTERLYSELSTGDWWWNMQERINASMPEGTDSVTIIPIILTSDKTHLSGSGKQKAWPLLMTIGNISNDVRFVPGMHCAEAIGMLPIYGGIEKHNNKATFRDESRALVHFVIKQILSPLEPIMKTGIRLLCADGKERFCFPVLCQHIGDMEEQWMLAGMKKGVCPKCKIINEDGSLHDLRNRTIRTDEDAAEARVLYDTGQISDKDLMGLGYHPTKPFSSDYPFGGILDALGPDLLHQVSKCFSDYLIDRFIWPYMQSHWKTKGISVDDLKKEFDSRFALVPGYTSLRRFREGIFTQKHHWTVHEHKEMMKITLGVLAGICPPDGLALVREYLHIHRLSHYTVHSEKTLGWLQSAVTTFWSILKNPNGGFVKLDLAKENFAVQRLHYFMHYPQSVREKGSLPSYSTDRTEIWHKPFKSAFRRSNKGSDSMRFILKEQIVLSAFLSMSGDIDDPAAGTNGTSQVDRTNGANSTATEDPDLNMSDAEEECSPYESDHDEIEGVEQDLEQIKELHKAAKTFSWPKRARPGFNRKQASTVESKISGLDGFSSSVKGYLSRTFPDRCRGQSEPIVSIFNNVTIQYPLWAPEDVGFGTVEVDNARRRQYILPGRRQNAREILRAGADGHSRRDCVLVNTPERIPRGQRNSMSGRRIAQLLCLFTAQVDDTLSPRLAFVHWFETRGQASETNGMYTVRRTSRNGVISILDIERGMHLIPKFGSQIGATTEMKKKIDKDRQNIKEGELVKSNVWLDIFPYYEEFFINNWVDAHTYKNIY